MRTVNGRGIQSIEIGGRLLTALARAVHPMMLRDLAEAAQMPPGQAHAYLVSFRKTGLVEQDAATGRYRLGPFALELGLARLRNSEPYQLAGEAVVDFAQEIDLAVAITVWGTYGPTVVRIQESSHQLHANVRPGTVFGLTTTATGKVFASFLPEGLAEKAIRAELERPAGGQRPSTVSLATMQDEIAEVRQRGFATTEGRPIPGISALSAPVFDHTSQIQLAITLMGPSAVVDCTPASPQAAALLAFTRELSRRLGHVPA
jgi:DNA-binding IclR family transcriptional regulator